MREFKFTNEHDEPIEGIEPVQERSFKKNKSQFKIK